MLYNITELATLFILYSVMGWVWETIVCSIYARKFVYRGLLLGPWCPIYGTGALLMLLAARPLVGDLASPNPDHWLLVFLASFAIGTIVELVTSGLLGKIFGLQLWTYEGKYSLNFRGKVALIPSLVWGVLGVALIYFINPPIWGMIEGLDGSVVVWMGLVLGTIFVVDYVMSMFRLSNFRKLIRAKDEKNIDVTDRYVAYVAKEIKNRWIPSVRKFIIKTLPGTHLERIDVFGVLGFKKPSKPSRPLPREKKKS